MSGHLLEVRDLKTHFFSDRGAIPAVDGVSFTLDKGQTIGIVGESGCGKTVMALSVMRLIAPPGKVVAGEILLDGVDLAQKSTAQMCDIRGADLAMIFQEPMTSLNPVHLVGRQVMEAIQLHQGLPREQARAKALEMFELVGIPEPVRRLTNYPHQLSGGLRQRVMIAMALSCRPKVLIADEPTTALDVTVQAQILNLLRDLQKTNEMAIMLITHDLGVVAEMADQVCVMYTGKVVEYGGVFPVFDNPLHPYTHGLYHSIPDIADEERRRLYAIKGVVPNLLHMPKGCSFAPRCEKARPVCLAQQPPLVEAEPGHWVRCWLYTGEVSAGE
ncbi:MAG TPA: ABC transporter ATP-binding protein [Symbiobacteriaceae bacterium]|jgi:oligopeptide/dipeptide ABC transporter ATP-binding protein